PSKYMKIKHAKPPEVGTRVYEPAFSGPGFVHPHFQGAVYALTDLGEIEIESWQETLKREESYKREQLTSRRLAIAAALLAVASLTSVVADAPTASGNIGNFFGMVVEVLEQWLGG